MRSFRLFEVVLRVLRRPRDWYEVAARRVMVTLAVLWLAMAVAGEAFALQRVLERMPVSRSCTTK